MSPLLAALLLGAAACQWLLPIPVQESRGPGMGGPLPAAISALRPAFLSLSSNATRLAEVEQAGYWSDLELAVWQPYGAAEQAGVPQAKRLLLLLGRLLLEGG